MVNTKDIQTRLDTRYNELNVTKSEKLDNITNSIALDIAAVLMDDNLFIDEKTIGKIEKIKEKLETINKDIPKEIDKLKTRLDSYGKKDDKTSLSNKIDELDAVSNNLPARIEEYTDFLNKGNNFNNSEDIPKIDIDTSGSTPTISTTHSNINLNEIFLNNGVEGENIPDKRKLCDTNGVKLKQDKDETHYKTKLPKIGGGTVDIKLYGIDIKNENGTRTLNISNIRFEPKDEIDFSEPLELSISASYTNVQNTGINITHNKELLLDINDGKSRGLDRGDITKNKTENAGTIIGVLDGYDFEENYFREHIYPGLEQDVIADAGDFKNHPDLDDIIDELYGDNGIIQPPIVKPNNSKEKDINNFFADYILGNANKKDYSSKENLNKYLKANREQILKQYFTEKINSEIRKSSGNKKSILQQIIERVDNFEHQTTSRNQLIKNPNDTSNESYTATVFVGNVEKVFKDDLIEEKKSVKFRNKFLLETKSGYQRRLERRAKIRARREMKEDSFRNRNGAIAETAVERTQYEQQLLQELGVDNNRQIETKNLGEFTQINTAARKFIKSNGVNPESTEGEFNRLLRDLGVIKKRQQRKYLASSRISNLQRVVAEKDIIDTIIKHHTHIDKHTTEIETKFRNFVEKYGEPEFISKLGLSQTRQGKFNLENKNFKENIVALAFYTKKLERLQNNIQNISISVNFVPEIQKANTIQAQINNKLEERLTKNGRTKLATMGTGTVIASSLAMLVSLLGLGGRAIAPSALLASTLAFFQKKGLHKQEVAKIQSELNKTPKDKRNELANKYLDQKSKILSDPQLNKQLEHELGDLKTRLENLVKEPNLDETKALELKNLLSLSTALKYCQHQYGITQLEGNNESDYNSFVKNIHFGIQKYKNFVASASNSTKVKLGYDINDKQGLDQINARFFLEKSTHLTKAMQAKGQEMQKYINRKANRRGTKDALLSGTLTGLLSFITSGIAFGFSSKTVGSGVHTPVNRGEHIIKNLRTPLDWLKPIGRTFKNIIHSKVTIPTVNGVIAFPTIPMNSDKLNRKHIKKRYQEIQETKEKLFDIFRRNPPKKSN